MTTLISKIESILLVSNRSLSIQELATLCDVDVEQVNQAIEAIIQKWGPESGIQLVHSGSKVQFASHPENASVIHKFIQEETVGELTRPQLETLTIIAYRGPITKEELEQIRGVTCTLVLRNLLMRGLVEEVADSGALFRKYQVTLEFMKYLGISEVGQLSDFETLRNDERIQSILEENNV